MPPLMGTLVLTADDLAIEDLDMDKKKICLDMEKECCREVFMKLMPEVCDIASTIRSVTTRKTHSDEDDGYNIPGYQLCMCIVTGRVSAHIRTEHADDLHEALCREIDGCKERYFAKGEQDHVLLQRAFPSDISDIRHHPSLPLTGPGSVSKQILLRALMDAEVKYVVVHFYGWKGKWEDLQQTMSGLHVGSSVFEADIAKEFTIGGLHDIPEGADDYPQFVILARENRGNDQYRCVMPLPVCLSCLSDKTDKTDIRHPTDRHLLAMTWRDSLQR